RVGSTTVAVECGLVDSTQSVSTALFKSLAVRHGIDPVQSLGLVDPLHHLSC
ncbi:unnamed protein product, partial [Musa textilis]